MSPKAAGKAKAKAAGGMPAAGAAAAAAGDAGLPGIPAVNADHMAMVDEAVQMILGHPLFAGIMNEPPLTINAKASEKSAAGHRVGFKYEDYVAAMKTAGEYEAAGNYFWVNWSFNATPGVPFNTQAVQDLKAYYFKSGPTRFPLTLEIALENISVDVRKLHGELRRVSPEEVEHALLLAVSESIKEGADEAVLREWRAVLLSVPMHFVVLNGGDALYWRAVNLREATVAQYDGLARSAVQRIFEVATFRARREKATGGKLSAEALDKEWAANARLAKSTTPCTRGFLETAMKVWDRLLSFPECRQVVLEAENEFGKGTPFDSVYKLEAIIQKAKTPSLSAWCLEHIIDLVRNKKTTAPEFAVRTMTGRDSGGRGTLDLILYKHQCSVYIAQEFLEAHPFSGETKHALRALTTHEAYRAKVGYPGAGEKRDMGWLGLLPDSGRLLIAAFEDRPQQLAA